MTQDTTVRNQDKAKEAEDLAPLPATSGAASLAGDAVAAVTHKAKPVQAAVHLEPTKRSKTWGERLFDLTTYGGFALVGNELAATAIVQQKEKPNLIGRAYRAGQNFLERIGISGELPYVQKRLNYISFAIIGGFLMVPFIKLLEDNKGRCVRFADKYIYGKKADSDQEIVRKHEEMDNAPVQTWSSLGAGRALTVASAYTVDATINWKDGFSARLLKGTRFENFASLEHLSDHVAEWANNKLVAIRKITPEASMIQKSRLKDLVGLSTLSATLTAIFYISSKVFAKKRDEKIERKYERIQHPRHSDDLSPEDTSIEAVLTDIADKRPQATVGAVTHLDTLARAPELAHGA